MITNSMHYCAIECNKRISYDDNDYDVSNAIISATKPKMEKRTEVRI